MSDILWIIHIAILLGMLWLSMMNYMTLRFIRQIYQDGLAVRLEPEAVIKAIVDVATAPRD